MSSKSPISRFEEFARGLLEGSFDRLLRQPGPLTNVAGELAAAATNSQRNGLTANHYVIRVHPETLANLVGQSNEIGPLMEAMLKRLGEKDRLVFAGDIHVELEADPLLEVGETAIDAEISKLEGEQTAVLSRKKGTTAPLTMSEAYLIVNGRRHVVLEKAVNTLGRSLENDIILENSGVSRRHAQIRWRNGHFEIFDLGSRAGTQVNGRQISSGRLRSGDVISLGAAALIYGEENSLDNSSRHEADGSVQITQELSTDELS